MKALIRTNEIYWEADWSSFTADHLDWHTAARPQGDGYALAQDAPADAEPCDFDIITEEIPGEPPEGEEAPVTIRRTAVLNSARYEARKAQEGAEHQPEASVPAEGEDGASAGASDQPETIIIDGVEYRPVGE